MNALTLQLMFAAAMVGAAVVANKPTKVTPPALARRWGVTAERICKLIAAGELRAIDVSLLPGQGKPRYLIDEADIEAFEERRRVAPPLPTPKRRRKPQRPSGFVRYFEE